jgi:uncharacterized protein YbjT (DUF2867 family)
MDIAIVGGTGTVGAATARELAARGHRVRVLARHAPEFRVDLTTGEGLARALAGVDVVIDAAQGTRRVLVTGTSRLLHAERQAGVAHHVAVSIVGIDRVGGPYYRIKLDQEAAIAAAGVPWTVVRATQFHTLVARAFAATAKLGVVPATAAPLQPIDPAEVAGVLADTAEADASGTITQIAGPEVLSVRELAHRWRAATGSRALLLPVPAPRTVRAGGLTNPRAPRGKVTFEQWLEAEALRRPAAGTDARSPGSSARPAG